MCSLLRVRIGLWYSCYDNRRFELPNTQSLTVFIRSDMAPKQLLRRNDKALKWLMCECLKFTSRVESLKMRRDVIDTQLLKISNAKAQTNERKRQLASKLKAVNETIRKSRGSRAVTQRAWRGIVRESRKPNWHWSCIAKACQQVAVQQQQQQRIQSEHGPVKTTRCSNMTSRRNESVF